MICSVSAIGNSGLSAEMSSSNLHSILYLFLIVAGAGLSYLFVATNVTGFARFKDSL